MKNQVSMQKTKELITQLTWEFIGSIFIAAGIYNFAVQAKFPMTGFSGISIILYRLLNVPIGLSTIILNIPLAIICYRLLGKKFFVSSLRCMVLSSLMIDYVAPLFPVYEGDRLLAALCTGVFGGNRICVDLFQKLIYWWLRLYYYGSESDQTTFISWENCILV